MNRVDMPPVGIAIAFALLKLIGVIVIAAVVHGMVLLLTRSIRREPVVLIAYAAMACSVVAGLCIVFAS
ncbi:hypothetical protein [Burkholderia vietnamiensis]|uniref:hypothetical protein n=1 Tax=Burkholderia vietnamiensis TaxID=60552 RepID=UPI001CF5EF60|nr:hypothetical protein [Burkholderia vietnamiensis]MCA8228239.1 hypothetical protein [Burkholderia vietnamiensis]